MQQLHLTLDESSTMYQRALARSKTGARGHIGTHLDCYTEKTGKDHYELYALIMDCTNRKPDIEQFRHLPSLKDKVLVLYTGNMEHNEYASEEYHATRLFIANEVLDEILAHEPTFILLDSHGMGESGKIHTAMDIKCEKHGCHVIENAQLLPIKGMTEARLSIDVDVNTPSSGKPCKIYVI